MRLKNISAYHWTRTSSEPKMPFQGGSMAAENNLRAGSVFQEVGLSNVVNLLKEEIRQLYREDRIPWVIGYSGGKDSTAIVQLVWLALADLPQEQRHKPIHVIST